MTLSDTEVRLIMAALRYTSTMHETIARQHQAKGERLLAQQHGGFAARCGELSDRLQREAQSKIIRPN